MVGKVWCFITTDRYSSEFILYDGSLDFETVKNEITKEFSGLMNCVWNKDLHKTKESYYTRLTPYELYELKIVEIKGKTNG